MAEAAQVVLEPMVEVFARPGSRISNDAAERVYREAQRLPEKERTAQRLVEIAQNPASEIHDLFTWDDQQAAEKWREQEARVLMSSVRVRIIHDEGVSERPAFFSVNVEEEPTRQMAYVRYSTADEDEALKEQLVKRAYRDLRAFQTRYARHREIFTRAAPALVEVLRLADEVL